MNWFIFLFALSAQAEIAKTDWTLLQGKLTYHVSYPLKKVEGVSENAKGKGRCEKDNCQFLIAIPVKSFDSGDANRDNHMLEVTKAGLFPVISVRLNLPRSSSIDSFKGVADISFGGESHTYQVPIKSRNEGAITVTSGRVPLKLSDFKMERPSLLSVKINDDVPVDFELRWQ